MTRTDVMASSRPHTTRMSSDRPGIFRRFLVVPAVLLVAMALVGPSTAFAAEGTSGYSQEPNKPTTTTTTTPTPTTSTPATSTTPSTETSPSKESTTPTTTETSPTASSTPAAKSAKSGTLPFTGFDLRWSIGIGLLLLGAGFSLLTVQRRRGGVRR
jgi:cytoskeletal protein RodZ